MSQPPLTDQELVAEYFLRDLSSDEIERLEQSLSTDEELRKHFTEAARDEWLLHHVHENIKIEQTEQQPAPLPFPKRNKWIKLSMRIAALFVVSAASLLFVKMQQTKPVIQIAQAEPAPPEAPMPIASVASSFTLASAPITISNQGQQRILEQHSELFDGDTVYVPQTARLSFQYSNEDTTVHLSGGSQFTLADADGAKHIQLTRGELRASVAKQALNKPMRVITQDAEAVVLGTTFELLADQHTRLSVHEGLVNLSSLEQPQSIDVNAGHFTQSTQRSTWQQYAFRMLTKQPIFDHSINENKRTAYLAIDPKRNYSSFLRFDLGPLKGTAIEAKLKLRVQQMDRDHGGSGTVRLLMVSPTSTIHDAMDSKRVEVASYRGKVGAGMDLIFDMDTSLIRDGINSFIIQLDPKGNDFWFSSSEGPVPPQLTLKIEEQPK